jgi:ubiquinone/menaquinone biosynthesis C-methylase UbiE
MRKIKNWLSEEELKSIYTSSYWNDIEKEKEKKWWIEDGNYQECLDFLDSSKLLYEYQQSEKFIKDFSGESIKVVDLAAGIGWTSVLLSKLSNVKEVHAVEISKHRLDSLFEHSVKMLKGDGDKIFRYLGSFYNLQFDDKSIDVIYMSQAFHHADKPLKLLNECDRVLKDNGRIILVGEHFIGIKSIIRKFLANLIKRKKYTTNFYEMFTPDQELGDHYYRQSDYYFMFQSMGYSVKNLRLKNEKVIYIADKRC